MNGKGWSRCSSSNVLRECTVRRCGLLDVIFAEGGELMSVSVLWFTDAVDMSAWVLGVALLWPPGGHTSTAL